MKWMLIVLVFGVTPMEIGLTYDSQTSAGRRKLCEPSGIGSPKS